MVPYLSIGPTFADVNSFITLKFLVYFVDDLIINVYNIYTYTRKSVRVRFL